jgi:hypothetical protein
MSNLIKKEEVIAMGKVDTRGVVLVLQGYLSYLLQPLHFRINENLGTGIQTTLSALGLPSICHEQTPLTVSWTNLDKIEGEKKSKFEIFTNIKWVANLIALWDLSRGAKPNKAEGVYAEEFKEVKGGTKGFVTYAKELWQVQNNSSTPFDLWQIEKVAREISVQELLGFQSQMAFRSLLLLSITGIETIVLHPFQTKILNAYNLNTIVTPTIDIIGPRDSLQFATGEVGLYLINQWIENGRGVRPYAMIDELRRLQRMNTYISSWREGEYSVTVNSKQEVKSEK